MKRYKYGLNGQTFQTNRFWQLLNVATFEVAPGDTISGKLTNRIISDSTTRIIQNRAYHDMYAFYVPHRLVWPEFPDWIAGDDTHTVPTVATSFSGDVNMTCNRANATNVMNAFVLRSYNLIWNQFFRAEFMDPVNLSAQNILTAPSRTTGQFRRLRAIDDITEETVAEPVTTGTIRTAFAQDRFNKLRQFYGDKYVDYLAAIGVQSSWSISDDPELIATSNKGLSQASTDATVTGTDEFLGDQAGRWQGSNELMIPRTFFPEHGSLIVISVPRMDVPLGYEAGHLNSRGTNRNDFWSPEFETEKTDIWRPFVSDEATLDAIGMAVLKYDTYRHGYTFARQPGSTLGTYVTRNVAATDITDASIAQEKLLYCKPDDIQDIFHGTFGETAQLTESTTHRLTRTSSVKPPEGVKPLS